MATGAENARANPLADCTTDTAMPRLRTKYRDSSGTNTTSPRQFAPSVITTPYSTTICQSWVAQAFASNPMVSSAPPIRISRGGPSRSTSQPTSGELMPLTICDTEYANETSARLQPNASMKVTRKTV